MDLGVGAGLTVGTGMMVVQRTDAIFDIRTIRKPITYPSLRREFCGREPGDDRRIARRVLCHLPH